MAAPVKAGLDYFSFDVGLMKDKKLRRAKLKYGYLATEVYIALLTLLYSDKGYYIPYETQEEKEDCIWYVLDCLQGKYQPDSDTIAQVIEELVAGELFSADHYPKNITSKRSQQMYYSATVGRKSVVIEPEIWMLTLDEMKELSEKHSYYLSLVSQSNNGVNRPINEVNQSIYPQSKIKESKVNKSKEDIVSKKVSKEKIESYDEIFEEMATDKCVKGALVDFIRHLRVNGVTVINSRLEDMIMTLDFVYGRDEQGKVKEIREAITNGYKRLPCEEVR